MESNSTKRERKENLSLQRISRNIYPNTTHTTDTTYNTIQYTYNLIYLLRDKHIGTITSSNESVQNDLYFLN